MKKLLLVLGMVTCMFLMPVSGTMVSAAGQYDISEDMVIEYAEGLIGSMNQIIESGMVEQYKAEAQSYSAIYDALVGYSEALEQIGTFQGIADQEVTYGEGIQIDMTVNGSEKNAHVTVKLDANLALTDIISTVEGDSAAGGVPEGSTDSLIVLVVLIAVIVGAAVITSAMNRAPKKEAAPAGSQVFHQIAKSEEKTSTEVANTPNLMNDAQLVAVIAAAIAAYEGNASASGYVVRSLRKRR